ncbi:MAG: tail fiber domain-containing protein [Bacteroidales bacterium]|nr:tail fiber domain-containing protein [Bacteroidales bacterium]
MKKLNLILLLCAVTVFSFGQLKVLNDGKVAIGGTNISNSRVQINVTEGENTGFKIYDTTWSESKFKINTSELYTYLSGWAYYPNLSMAFTCDAGINIGEKPYLTEYSGGLLNIFTRNTYGYNNCGIFLRTTNNSSVGIYSSVDNTTKLTFASGLSSGSGNYNFYVRGNGEAYTQGILVTSDSTLKQEIQSLSGSLDKILKMRGVSYRYKNESFYLPKENLISQTDTSEVGIINPNENRKKSSAIMGVPKLDPAILKKIENEDNNLKHIGLLAQEVELVSPEVVRTSVNGTKAIAYTELIALLIEGMKEQQTQIETLREEINAITGNSQASIIQKSALSSNDTPSANSNDLNNESATLYQNNPNPFSQSTQIHYYLPETVGVAYLCIYNLQGKQLKQIAITSRGEGSQTINGSEFSAGIYLYGLIADGQQVDVKRMILTE